MLACYLFCHVNAITSFTLMYIMNLNVWLVDKGFDLLSYVSQSLELHLC